MDKIITLENQLRTLSEVPPGALPKDNNYKAYNNFMKYRSIIVVKQTSYDSFYGK
jgi:hypothetical protein